jgi:ATP-dependent DNA helicase PIF1
MRPTPVQLDHHATFRRAIDLMNNTRDSLFITGKAGTGKSTLLDYFMLHTTKKAVVLAPTGVAALNVRGQTIHRFFNFYIDVTPEQVRTKKGYRPRHAKVMGKLDTLIIDEVSMLRADLLDCIEAALRHYGPAPGTPFGGVQMVFVGDLYQLPPVVGREEQTIFKSVYESPYFFSATCLRDHTPQIIELDKVYRQKDQDFIALLNRIRNNAATDDDLATLNTRVVGDIPPPRTDDDLTVTLTTTNTAADAINDARLDDLPGREYQNLAEISGDFTKDYYPTATTLRFKIGAQIMLLNNDSKNRWVNGSIGVITAFDRDEDDNDVVRVRLDGRREVVDVYPFLWEVFKFKASEGQIVSEAVGTFAQYPFRLAWAVTIHKSQGKTFDQVCVDMGRGAFAAGQTYVALSRCTSFEGLSLLSPIRKTDMRTDPNIGFFFGRDALGVTTATPVDDKVTTIQNAIDQKRALKLDYLKADGTPSHRVVEPLSVGPEQYKGHDYMGLRGFCIERQENRVFRIDRIARLEIVDRPKKKAS